MARSRNQIIESILGYQTQTNENPENLEVARSINRGLGRIGMTPEEASGGEDGSGGLLGAGLNVLGRTFDVLSRPLYAITNVVENVQETGNFRPFGQIWQGLSGQDKVTGSDIMENIGATGLGKGLGGFGLDVVLDPLTYTGVGLIRKPAEEAIQHVGLRALKEYTEQATQRGTAAQLAKVASEREAVGRFLREGFSITEANAGAKSIGRQQVLDAAEEAAMAAQTAARNAERGRVTLRVLGRDVAGSERLYRAGSLAATRVGSTRGGRALNKAFRPVSTFVAGSNTEKRISESIGMAKLEHDANVVKNGGRLYVGGMDFPGLNHLTDDEAWELADAIESLDPAQLGKFADESAAVRQLIRQIGIDEQGTFIDPVARHVTRGELIDNYVHHYFTGEDDPVDVSNWISRRKNDIDKANQRAIDEAKEQADTWAREQKTAGIDVTTPEFNIQYNDKLREFFELIPKKTKYTLKRAVEEGLHPVTDIRQILGNHLQQHYREIGRVRFLEGMVGEFGLDLGDNALAAARAKKLGMVQLPDRAPAGTRFEAGEFIGKNVYFPKEIAKAIQKYDQIFYTDEAAGAGLLSMYDQALSWLKFGQTVVNPGFHVRNAMSDISLNFLDGVTDPRVYGYSAMIHRATKNSDPLSMVDDMFSSGNPLEDAAATLDDIRIPVGGSELSGEQVERLFIESGSKSGYYRSEITTGKGGITEKLRKLSESREDWARRAHFIDALQKEGKNLPAPDSSDYITKLHNVARKAGERVRKYNIDYGDLTPFEQRTMRRVVPFYTWMRKNIPLQIEGLFMRPGRAMVAPKIIRNLQAMMGQGPEDTDILGLNSLPDYMRSAMHVNVVGEGEGRNGVYWNPGSVFPVMDLNEFFGQGTPRDLLERQLSGLTPFAQVPIQQITGYNFYSGRPQRKGILQNILETTPMGRYSYGISQGDSPWTTRLTNLATGASLTSLNEGMQRGELRRQEDIIQAILRERANSGV